MNNVPTSFFYTEFILFKLITFYYELHFMKFIYTKMLKPIYVLHQKICVLKSVQYEKLQNK